MNGPIFFFLFMIGQVRLESNGAMTHLQKYSPAGIYITYPFCFHAWVFWRKQTFLNGEPNGGYEHWYGWVPGTEQGIYFRTPGFRYDTDLGMKWTWGYLGTHWD
jgi:hypothetical protein